MFEILALYLSFEGAKNIHILKVLIWGFRGWWRFLTGVWHLDIDLDMFRILDLYLDFEGKKNIHVL